jgi:hypothetical protein
MGQIIDAEQFKQAKALDWLAEDVTAFYRGAQVTVTRVMGDEVYFKVAGSDKTSHAGASEFTKE